MLGKPSKRLQKKLEESGVHAQAKVLQIAERGMAVTNGAEGVISNTTLALKCELEITPPDGTPAFKVGKRFRFEQLAVPSAGMTIAVIYNPEDHDEVILDESPQAVQGAVLAGAGIDSDQIAQALAAAKQWQQQAGAAGFQIPGAAAAGSDSVGQLERLAKLHESGALTDAEFAAEKGKLIGS